MNPQTSCVRLLRLLAVLCIFTLFGSIPASAQVFGLAGPDAAAPPPPPPLLVREPDGRVVVRATRVTEAIKVDGRLDEEVYFRVPAITDLIQTVPRLGAPVSERTEVWILYDDEKIYIVGRLWDTHPERIVADDMRRGSSNLAFQDNLSVAFDTFHDRRNSFLFYTTPVGGMREAATIDEKPNHDWRTIWKGAALKFDQGWTVEMEFPFKSLRYGPGREQTWGIQFRRRITSKNELAHLTLVDPAWGGNAINHPSAFADLVGLEVPPAARNIEVRPYVLDRVTTDLASTPPYQNKQKPDAGVDAKYGLTKSLTADFTYRTDFAEVEDDTAQVNLTRFSLYFPEKRQFFLEGQGIFGFAGTGGESGSGDVPVVFYSRRIGLNQGRVVPVMGGARLSGMAGKWSIGALNMETDDEATAKAVQTNFTVLRVKRNVLRRSMIGGIFTHRSVSMVAPGANTVFGVDANLAFYRNVYFTGFLGRSDTSGRPGDDLTYQGGFKYTADRYGLTLDRMVVQKNFNPELGFLRRQDFQRSYAEARFSPRTTHNRLVRLWTYTGSLEYIEDNAGVLQWREQQGSFKTEFHNSNTVTLEVSNDYELLPSDFKIATDVVVPAGGYTYAHALTTFSSGQQNRFTGSLSFDAGSLYGGTKQTAACSGRVKFSPRLSTEPNVSLNWVDLPQGAFMSTVVGARTTFTVSPWMFVAALIQYNSAQNSVSTNLRFRWEYRPGSELFLVYTDGRSTLPLHGTVLQNRGIVFKINRLVRF